jgi:hypothetical protein
MTHFLLLCKEIGKILRIINLVILSYFLVAISAAHAALRDHVITVQRGCPIASTLLIKKSAVELSSAQSCQQNYTEKLLQGCSDLDCQKLIDSFKYNLQERSGSVVGE